MNFISVVLSVTQLIILQILMHKFILMKIIVLQSCLFIVLKRKTTFMLVMIAVIWSDKKSIQVRLFIW